MRARTFLPVLFLLIPVALIRWQSAGRAQVTRPQPAPEPSELQAVTLIFGSKDAEPSPWDGSVTISKGAIERVRGYHFDEKATVNGTAWKCSTVAWPPFGGGMHPNEKPQPRGTPVEPTGVTIEFRAPADAELTVTVPRGTFSFRPMDVPETGGIFPLQAMVEVYRTPVVESLTSGDLEDDYPSLAVDGDRVWVAWQAYRDESEQVLLRAWENGRWGETLTVTPAAGDLFMTGVAASGGRVLVVWSQRDGSHWRLMARDYDGARFGAVQTVTEMAGNHIFHRVASDGRGGAHVVYQGWRGGRADIFLRSYSGGRWSPEVNLSDPARDPRANDWSPAVAVSRDGTVWVAWDSYASGSYNLRMRAVRKGKPGPLMKVTDTTRFHAHAALTVDARNRVWIAWDEAPENWGKDVAFLLTGGTGLYDSRAIRVAVYDPASAGQWLAPLRQPEDVVPYSYRRYVHTARLAVDSAGRVWLFARPRTQSRLPTTLWAAGGKWEVIATYYNGDRWSEVIPIPDSVGRNEGEIAVGADSGGNVIAAFVTDQRLWGGPNFGHMPRNNEIMAARLRVSEAFLPLALAARTPEPAGATPSEPRERQQVAALRNHTIAVGGKTYRIYRGDLHRHTDISMDGAGDGSLWDAYRYAIDAAQLDYLGVTDHQSGSQEYTWWRIDKSADLFHVPGFFTALFATERSLSYPQGHRNLVFAQRGVRILPITPQEQKTNTGPLLYPYLRKNKGIASSHTSHTNMGTDWRDNDKELEPIVEIFQGARTSAEREGAPLSPTEKRTELWAGGYRPLGFVDKAWSKGYKLGVQASSDHVSTHTSYACVIAESSERQALLDAMRKRHTYAATSNILLDYRVTADGQVYLQGDEVVARSLPELTARIVGTGPLKEVVIVRDNQYIYSQAPAGETFDLRFRDEAFPPGEHFYYVRVEQKDGNVAWSSPVWVRRP